ncbi:MBG domain-containing protein [Reyranella sp. CPCC 100927]|uniref:MBG domain-containing protein n=1 Tax=Reyranella sp. CPCC 100927 TaxID=2599616 RepID=UPI0015B5C18E|nr:MBG domain-containing protein [Reyranella sp. CPCC 100927]
MGVAPAVAQTLPTGGAVAAGRVSIGTPSPGQMTINQSTSSAIVNWQSFSVGAGSSVTIVQPSASSALLNRVNGNTPSTIAGSINANGQVYLVNPNGITITGSGTVNAAGFVASTLGISDDDFTSGRRSFAGKGASAAVVNHGTISIGRGGYAALIGGSVDNAGTISVPLGRVGLGSGEQARLDLSGDGFLQVAVPTKANGQGALVSHSGRISADGGRIEIRAAAAREAVRQAVNLSGVVEARTVSGRSGEIVLGGSDGQVNISGRLDVSAPSQAEAPPPPPVKVTPARLAAATPASRAGAVTVTARAIDLKAATIDASGVHGGGTVRIGGDVQGTGTLQRAEVTRVDAATTIRADAISVGDGGRVIIWSDADTRFEGNISARGGQAGGNGGFAEVSGKAHLTYVGVTDLTAAHGQFGTLLLDPYNVTISNGANSNQVGFTAVGNDSVINVTTLQTALATANVMVTTGASGSQAGNITVADALTWSGGSTLTLQAAGAITLNAGITATSGGLALSAGGAITTGAGGSIDVGAFTLQNGNWTQVSGTLPAFNATDFRLAGGTFLRALGGDGSTGAPYAIADVYGLQGMDGYRASSVVLANDIDATGTARWNWDGTRYQGFNPIGGVASPFRGRFDGSGNTIANLAINRPSQDYVGLFGAASAAVITDVGLIGGTIAGASRTGTLVGMARDGTSISRVYATGTVSGLSYVGGLVGTLWINSTLTQAYVTGAVSGDFVVGGLAGRVSVGASISQGYVTGAVSGRQNIGGVVGDINEGVSLSQVYASGRVTGTFAAGGIAGYYDRTLPTSGTITASYWDTQTTGQANAIGQLIGALPPAVGLTTAQARTLSSYAGFDFTNTWFQTADMRPIGRWEAARPVNGVIAISTLNQLQLMAANPGASYALDRDIDARASSGSNAAGIYTSAGFVPVGAIAGSGFTGAFNGMDHMVDGLTINRPSASGLGLFGAVGYGGNVSNIGLTNVTVVGGTATGGIAGVNNGVLNRAYVTGTVTGTNSVGGLVGMSTGVIVYSYTDAAVRGTNDTGGLIGSNNGAVQYTYAIGSVNGSGGASTGGLVGRNATGSGVVDHSYASGAVTGTAATGGLVGTNEATVINSFWDMGTTGQSTSAGGTGLTTAQARVSSSYAGWNFLSVWFQADGSTRPIGRWEMAAPVNGVTTISNLHQLQLIGGQLDGRYVLDRNIDATPTSGANPAGIWDASGFNPLGSAVAVGFSGTFDGQGHVITGLTINRPTTSQVGLFGYTSDATIRRVGLVGGQVTGQDSVGALVGRAYGSTISDTFASTKVSGNNRVGGLLGENNGTWGGGDVMRSFATGAVTATGQTVGGFVGWNSNATISQSYATGTVTNTSGTVIGGFAGWNAGTIRQAYATGAAAGGTTVGGFVGLNSGALDQVYSTGAVTGTGGLGGLVGARQPTGTATASYWNTETSGRTASQGGTGRTSAAMQTQAGFAGFDWAVWSAPDTTYRPELFGVSGVVGVSANMTRYYGDANPTTPGYIGAGYWNTITSGGSLSTTATATSGVGLYGMTVSGVAGTFTATGGASRIVYLGSSLYVAPRPITVTARGQSRAYGDGNPALIYDIMSGSLVNGDSLAGALTTTATGTSNVGLYGITQGTLSASSNYALTYVGADLEVTRRAITVVAGAKMRAYGDANPALTYGIMSGSLVNGDMLSGGLTTSADGRSGVGAYAITQGTLAVSSNYALTYVGADLVVAPRQIEVTADAQSRPYGNANQVLTWRITGGSLVNGDALPGGLATSADGRSGVGTYAITQGSLGSANYDITYVGADLTVTPRAIIVTADQQSRLYGDANPTLTYTVAPGGLVNGDTLSGALTTAADSRSGAGSYVIAQGSLGSADSNYAITYFAAALAVMPRPIEVTADAQSRAYGDANPALTWRVTNGSLVNGDTLSGGLSTSADARSGVGTYAITRGILDSPNYAITYIGADLTVTPRPVTITADAQSRHYGDANPALTYRVTTGALVNGDTLSGGLATSADIRSGVGTYAITQGSLEQANYAITYVGADLTVTPRPMTITADAQSRIYGDANPVLTYRITSGSLVNDDTLSGAVTTDAHSGSSVGAYAITRGTLAASANYALTYVGANLTVTSRSITVTADAQSRVYGDANPGLTYRITSGSLASGDTLDGQLATAATPTSGVGRYSIERGSLSSNPNYAFTYVGADLTVTQRPITVTADAQSRVYGDANPALTHRVTEGSLVNGDTLSGDLATAANGTANIGAYAITQGTLAISANYALTYVGADLAVTPRPITVTGDTLSRAYGDANPALTYAVTSGSLVNGDSLTGALATTATSTSSVGDYVITQGTLAASANYALTYSKATLSVTQRPITVTADALSRIYGDANPALTYRITAGSLVNGDGLSGAVTTDAHATSSVGAYAISQGTLAASSNYALTYAGADLTVTSRALTITADALSRVYGDANPALTYRITSGALVNGDTLEGQLVTGAGAMSNVGRYGIERGSLSPNPNYALTYVGADLTVTPRPITVTAGTSSRVYGDGNPALTWAITSGNLMNEDRLTGGLATAATGTSGVGVYAITQGTLAASSNYAVSYVGADLAITPRPIAVRADAQSRIYGNANPVLTYAVTSEGGLVNGDTLSGALGTTATATSDVGTYVISQGTLGSPNYALTFTGADLAVTPRSITVTAQAASRVYGDATAFTFATSDRGAGAAVVGALSSAASVTSGIGTYAIGQGTVSDINNPNYRITYVGADLTITPRPITVTADSRSVTAGQALPPLTYGVGGRGLVNGDTLSGDLATDATTASAPGAYAIGQGTLAASANYQMTFVPGTLTLVPAAAGTAELASMIDRTIRAINVQWRPFSSGLNDVAAAQSSVGNGVLVEDPRFSGLFFCLGAPALSSCGSAPR